MAIEKIENIKMLEVIKRTSLLCASKLNT